MPYRTLILILTAVTLAPANLRSQAAPIPPTFSPAKAATYRDSFALLVNGQEQGFHWFQLERRPSGFVYREAFVLGQMNRTLEVDLDGTLQVRRSRAQGQAFGQPMDSELTYLGNRVTGRAWVRSGDGKAREVQVTQSLPPGCFDGLALMGLLPTLQWEADRKYSLTMYDANEGIVTTQSLRISDRERIRVPAGVFDTYRADLSTTQAPVRIWVSVSAPHRLTKVGSTDETFATVLVAQGHPPEP